MRRAAVLLTLVFAMIWQSIALARPGSTVNVLVDSGHAALHWQEASHHHHDDGSYHVDDSSESFQHVVADHVSTSAALTPCAVRGLLPGSSESPPGLHQRSAPYPFLDGLLRPPRTPS